MNKIEKYVLLMFITISQGVINGQVTHQWNVQDSVVLSNVAAIDSILFEGFDGELELTVINSMNKDKFIATVNDVIPISFFKGLQFSGENDPKIVSGQSGTLQFKLPEIEENQEESQNSPLNQTDNRRKKTSVFHDAIAASDYIKDGNYTSSNQILKLYGSSGEISENNYLKNYYQSRETGNVEATGGSKSSGGFLSSIGGLDVTKYADGLAKFLVKRTKEELSVAFFNNFKNTLNDTTYRDLKTLFPQTETTLSLIGDNIYNYQQYINSLREQFEQDLKQLPDNLPGIIPNHPQYFQKYPEKEVLLEQFSFFASYLSNGSHPGDIINDLNWKSYQEVDSVFASSLASLQLFSGAFRDTIQKPGDPLEYWVDGADVRQLFTDSLSFQLFMGFLVEEARDQGIAFGQDSLYHLLNNLKEDYDKNEENIKGFLRNISEDLDRMNTIISNYRAQKEVSFDDVVTYFQYTINIFDNILELEDVLDLNIPYDKEAFEGYLTVARSLCNLIADVNHKKYASAIIEVGVLYEFTFGLFSDPDSIRNDNKVLSKTKNLIIKYGSFMAAMTQAETSDDVANVIETFALPSGSYSVKRESNFNISLNAYVGLMAGREKSSTDDNDSYSTITSVTAPVGVGFYWGGIGGDSKSSLIRSAGIQFNIIDIGAITAFRFSNDSLDVPQIYLKEIISPGITASFGFKNIPLSLNLSWQVAPRLRRIGIEENAINLDYQSRFGVSLVVDIPLLNFKTVPRE